MGIQSEGKKRQLSHNQVGPDVVFTFHHQMKAQQQLCDLSSPPRLLMCSISMTPCAPLPLLSHSSEEPCSCRNGPRALGVCVRLDHAPCCSDGDIPRLSPTADTTKHPPHPHSPSSCAVGSEFGGFHTEVTPNTIKLKSAVPGTATGAKAQEVRH